MYPLPTEIDDPKRALIKESTVNPQNEPRAKYLKSVNTAVPSIKIKVNRRLPIFDAVHPKNKPDITIPSSHAPESTYSAVVMPTHEGGAGKK